MLVRTLPAWEQIPSPLVNLRIGVTTCELGFSTMPNTSQSDWSPASRGVDRASDTLRLQSIEQSDRHDETSHYPKSPILQDVIGESSTSLARSQTRCGCTTPQPWRGQLIPHRDSQQSYSCAPAADPTWGHRSVPQLERTRSHSCPAHPYPTHRHRPSEVLWGLLVGQGRLLVWLRLVGCTRMFFFTGMFNLP